MKIYLKSSLEFATLLATKGLTQRGFAREIGVSYGLINNTINGKAIGAKSVKKICDALKIKFHDYFFVEDITNVS